MRDADLAVRLGLASALAHAAPADFESRFVLAALAPAPVLALAPGLDPAPGLAPAPSPAHKSPSPAPNSAATDSAAADARNAAAGTVGLIAAAAAGAALGLAVVGGWFGRCIGLGGWVGTGLGSVTGAGDGIGLETVWGTEWGIGVAVARDCEVVGRFGVEVVTVIAIEIGWLLGREIGLIAVFAVAGVSIGSIETVIFDDFGSEVEFDPVQSASSSVSQRHNS